jgi:hypothetical protein
MIDFNTLSSQKKKLDSTEPLLPDVARFLTSHDAWHVNFLMFDFNLWLLFFFSRDVDGKVSILVEKVL